MEKKDEEEKAVVQAEDQKNSGEAPEGNGAMSQVDEREVSASDNSSQSADTLKAESAKVLNEKPVADQKPEEPNSAEQGSVAPESETQEAEPQPPQEPETQNTEAQKPVAEKQPPKAQPKKPAVESKATKSGKKGGGPIKWILLLCLLAGLCFAGYWIYLQQNKNTGLEKNLEAQQQSFTAMQQQLVTEREVNQRQGLQQEQLLTDIQLRLNSHSKRLRELSTTTRDDWLLAEAEYLMRLANQRLLTERSTKNATALLGTADQILRDLDDVDLFPVRKALASDITALKMAANIDREGLYLKLNAISEQVAGLAILSENPLGENDVEVPEETPATSESWRDKLSASFGNMWQQLIGLVRVQRRDGGVEPLLTVSDEIYARHNLRIMLEQAQLALLREEAEVYRTSLVKAQQWLTNYFALNEQSTIIVEQIQDAAAQPVVQVLPDISESLEGLRVFIDNWHKRQSVGGQEGEAKPGQAQ